MRADRLVAVLLLLQARGQVTAAEVADELEVSTRTARRDLEALAMSGVPIYSRAGRGGGWSLIGGASTDLTGLTGDEARALFLTVGASATASPALRSAVRKLVQALPEPFRDDADRAGARSFVDEAAWGRRHIAEPLGFLEPLQRAVVTERQIELGYLNPYGRSSLRRAHPLGLVTKAGIWYLIAGTDARSETDDGRRTFRVGRVTSVEVLDDPVDRPADFDLGAAWRDIVVRVGELRHPVRATGRAHESVLRGLRMGLGDQVQVAPTDDADWFAVTVGGESDQVLAVRLAGFAHGLEIDEPSGVREELAAIGRRLGERYAP